MLPFSSSLCRLRDMLVLTMRIFQSKVILLTVYKTKWHTVYIRISLCTYNQLEIYFLVQWKQGRVLSESSNFLSSFESSDLILSSSWFFPPHEINLCFFTWFFFFFSLIDESKFCYLYVPCFCFKQAMEEKRKGKA